MRFIAYCILIPCLFFLCLGTASAHPHKSGQSDHGPSLENYLTDLDFTTGNVVKEQKNKIIVFFKHGKNKNNIIVKNNKWVFLPLRIRMTNDWIK